LILTIFDFQLYYKKLYCLNQEKFYEKLTKKHINFGIF